MSNETKWTPGPWRVEVDSGWYLVTRFGRIVCSVNPESFDTGCPGFVRMPGKCNSHLIAAAPELYEALECCANWFSSGDYNLDCIRKAKAALAKARGEQ